MQNIEYCQEELDKDYLNFINSIKRINESRVHKVKNSYGVYDGFKYYRKNKPKEHKYVLNESQYFSIIRKVNKLLGEELINGEDVTLPYRLGRLEIRKYNAKIVIDGKKIRTNLPIDWDRTLKLWYEDKESYKNKTLIKVEEKEIYKIYLEDNNLYLDTCDIKGACKKSLLAPSVSTFRFSALGSDPNIASTIVFKLCLVENDGKAEACQSRIVR